MIDKTKFYSEEELVNKHADGEISWLEYVCHHSEEQRRRFFDYCKEHDLPHDEQAAIAFLEEEAKAFDEALINGEI